MEHMTRRDALKAFGMFAGCTALYLARFGERNLNAGEETDEEEEEPPHDERSER